MIFGQNMKIHCAELVNWDQLWERKTNQHLKENLRENKSRSNYKYKIGGKVLILTKTTERGGKLMDFAHKGPFEILELFDNGTIKIKRNNFQEIIHIRRVRPFYDK